jgi:hypothetical protein
MARRDGGFQDMLLVWGVAGSGIYAYYHFNVQPKTGLTFFQWFQTLFAGLNPLAKPDPDLQVHATAWQHAQCPSKDPNDWAAFRLYEMANGFKDPGLYVPAGLGWGWTCI